MNYIDCNILHKLIEHVAANKGLTLTRTMLKQLYAELQHCGTFKDTFDEALLPQSDDDPEYEEVYKPFTADVAPAEPVGVNIYKSLKELVVKNVDKPPTQWQINQLNRWDDALRKDPPENSLLLEIPVSQEIQEKRHQIKRIQAVSGFSKARAENMYDSGIRVIEQE